jgi:signal transduction histidine kinase
VLVFTISITLAAAFLILHYILRVRELTNKLKESEKRYGVLQDKNEEFVMKLNEETALNKQKNQILIQQSRLASMGEMIAIIGHHWSHPLNSLSLLIQDVRDALQFGEINDQYINQFTQESMIHIKHMSRTINDFRKFYQPDKEKRNFSVTDSIENALSIFSSTLKNQDIHVNFVYREKHMAYGYPNEYNQVVLNILTNAHSAFVKNDVNSRKLDIKIGLDGSFIVVDFTDNAGKIEDIDLYMAQLIMENMDGTVTVEHTEGGTRFSLSIPIAASEKLPILITV